MARIFLLALFSASLLNVSAASAQSIKFGDDNGDYALDSECDDPRFVGWGVATSTSEENIMHDASDCQKLFNLGQIRLNRTKEQSNVSECAMINFGDNSSEWARDNECDDPRFTGGRADDILNFEDIGADADDCQLLCRNGTIWLR